MKCMTILAWLGVWECPDQANNVMRQRSRGEWVCVGGGGGGEGVMVKE